MIILNQNRDEFVNFENIMCVNITDCQEDGFLISAGFIVGRDDNYRELGYYKTEKRVKEVFQEIIKAYKGKRLIQFQGNLRDKDLEKLNKRYEKDVIYYDLKTEIKQMTNDIYEMPKE